MTDDNNNNIIPYETLKASLDEAVTDMTAKSAILLDSIHKADPPLYMAIALHHFNAAYALVTARINAIASEYGHLAEITQNVQNQRDEIKGKFEALKKTVKQLNQLNLDDEQNDKKDQSNQNDKKDQNAKGKRRKK